MADPVYLKPSSGSLLDILTLLGTLRTNLKISLRGFLYIKRAVRGLKLQGFSKILDTMISH